MLLIIKNKLVVKRVLRVLKMECEAKRPGGGILPPSTMCIQTLCLYTFVCAIIISEEICKGICTKVTMSKDIYMQL